MAYLYEVKKGKKDSVKSFILDQFSKRSDRMSEIHRSWMLNLAWVRGYQNVDYDLTNKRFQTANLKHPWKVRLISNLMLPIVRRNVAQLIHTSSVWDVVPATPDEEDLQISRVSKKILLNYWTLLEMAQKLIRVAYWQSVCSSAFLKVSWNPSVGDEISIATQDIEQQNIERFMELMGFTEIPETITVNEGELEISVIAPFNLTFEPNASIMSDSPWVIESQIKTKDWVVETYGNKWKNLTETSEQELFVYPFIHGERTGKLPKKGVLVHEFFAKKSKKFKEGLHCVLAGGEVIKAPDRNPYDHGELPYSHFMEIYDPGSLWGTNTAEQIRPQQARYNRVSSGILENINLNSNIQWLTPQQSGVKQLTNKPGQNIRYNAPFKPEQVQLKPIPAYVEGFLNRTRLDIQDTASNHDVSEAKAEPGVRSGRAVLALQDADDSIKGPTLLWFDKALAKTGRLALQTLSQFITEDKVIEIEGEFNELESITFNGKMLRGQSRGDYFKVRVSTYGRQPMSRSAREAMVRSLIELQLLNPITNKEELLHILGAADLISIYDINSSDRIRQWNEIQAIIQGEDIKVYFGQNHDIHILTLKKYVSSGHWDKLEDKQKEAISIHLRRHLEQQVIETIYQQAFAQGLINAGSTRGQSREEGSRGGGKNRQRTGQGAGQRIGQT